MTEAMQLTCFKAYDIRAKLGAELNEEIAYHIGRSVAQVLQTTYVVIGMTREKRHQLSQMLCARCQRAGANVLDIGLSARRRCIGRSLPKKPVQGLK